MYSPPLDSFGGSHSPHFNQNYFLLHFQLSENIKRYMFYYTVIRVIHGHYQNKNWGGLELITFLAQYGFGIEKTYTFTHLEVFTFCPFKQTLCLLQQK